MRPAVGSLGGSLAGLPWSSSKDPLRPVTWTWLGAVSRMLCDSNSVESATQTLHRLTSVERFDEARALEPPVDDPAVVQGFTPTDLHRLPWFYKRYHDGPPRIDLPRRLTATTAGAVDVLAGTAYVPRAQLDLSELGRLLFLMSGVTRTAQRPFGRWLFRAAGSAGGRFPLEVYVAVPEGSPLPSGVHWYQPEQHALLTVVEVDRSDRQDRRRRGKSDPLLRREVARSEWLCRLEVRRMSKT